MKRLSLVVSVAWVVTAAAEAKAPQRQAPPRVTQIAAQRIQPGTYQTTDFVTRFDPKGGWTTTSAGTSSSGRYAVDGETIIFRTTPPSCENERVTYRIVMEPEGFRLEFVSDSCQRGGASYRFVPVRTIAK